MKEECSSSHYSAKSTGSSNMSPTRQPSTDSRGLTFSPYLYNGGRVSHIVEASVPTSGDFGKVGTSPELFGMGTYHSQRFVPYEFQATPVHKLFAQSLNSTILGAGEVPPQLTGLHSLDSEVRDTSSYSYGLYDAHPAVPHYTSTYDPFQGSPLQIGSLSSLTTLTYEPPPVPDPVPPVTSETIVAGNSKRTYKDALSKSAESQVNRSESPVFEPAQVVPAHANSTPVNAEAEIKKQSYKDKLLSSGGKVENASPVRTSVPMETKHSAQQLKANSLNNHRFPGRQSVTQLPKKRPLNINNNLSTNTSAAKDAGNKTKKNLNIHNDRNEAVRSVRSQTEPSSLPSKPTLRSRSTSAGSKSRSTSDSDKDTHEPYVEETSINDTVRIKEKIKEKSKGKAKEKERTEGEKTRKSGRRGQQQTQQHSGTVLARNFLPRLYKGVVWFCLWLYSLCADIIRLSFHIAAHWLSTNGAFCCDRLKQAYLVCKDHVKRGLAYVKDFCLPPIVQCLNWFRRKDKQGDGASSVEGLDANIPLPTTGEEAMRRLLACKGRDPYSILGVKRDCSAEDIRRYYKKQAVLVHPDKNRQRGAEEAFKILAHAFELIGDPARRAHYDNLVTEAKEMEAAWGELNELLARLHAKMDEAANTIRCTNCAKRHKRIKTSRPCYAARYCKECKINHSAREGDLWAESRFMGFLCYYYACMEGAVYDITEWANCQAAHLRHLTSNSHRVQYRIVPGSGQQQQQQQQQQQKRSGEQEDEEDWSESELKGIFRDLSSKGVNGFDARNGGQRRRHRKK